MSTHPYYVAKAAAAFLNAGGSPAHSAQLARWAQAHKNDDRAGVIIAVDGEILAETERITDRGGSAWWVTDATEARFSLRHNGSQRVDAAVHVIAREAGRPVIHVCQHEVCRGARQHIRPDALAFAESVQS